MDTDTVLFLVGMYAIGAVGVISQWRAHRQAGLALPAVVYGAMWALWPVTCLVILLLMMSAFAGWLLGLALPPER